MAATSSISFFSFTSSVSHGHGSKQLRSTIGRVPVTVKPANHVLPSLARRCNLVSPAASQAAVPSKPMDPHSKGQLKRSDFPPGFLLGAGSSAYQVEGAYNQGGRGLSIWDAFTHDHNLSNGDVTCDQYHRYKEDVKLLKDSGMDVYRFSISWSRILPKGTIAGGINQEGIAYYNNLINELKANGITPFVTLFHFDVPLALEEAYGGFLDRQIVNDFKEYACVCFKEFGDRVQHWATVNEPSIFTFAGYDLGIAAPGRCSDRKTCAAGDSATEPYLVSHNIILSHATIYRLYQDEFKGTQNGEVGITLSVGWMYPYTTANEDSEASERILDFQYGWHMQPLVHGDYPFIMKALVKERLPTFTPDEKKLIQGAYDFFGINYYSSSFAQALPYSPTDTIVSSSQDSYVSTSADRKGKPIGPKVKGSTQYMSPDGIKEVLLYTRQKYNNPPIYITENGIADDKGLDLEHAMNDKSRIDFYAAHLKALKDVIKKGANVKGFFAWSLLDSFEWVQGYTIKMGFTYVDFNDDLKRSPKASLEWYKQICTSK